jgi:hypothetical protein
MTRVLRANLYPMKIALAVANTPSATTTARMMSTTLRAPLPCLAGGTDPPSGCATGAGTGGAPTGVRHDGQKFADWSILAPQREQKAIPHPPECRLTDWWIARILPQ